MTAWQQKLIVGVIVIMTIIGAQSVGVSQAQTAQHELTQEEFDEMLNATMSISKSAKKMMEFNMIGEGERVIVDTGTSYFAQNFPIAYDIYHDLKDLAFSVNTDDKGSTINNVNFLRVEHEYHDIGDSPYSHTLYSYEGDRKPNQVPDVMMEFANYTKLDGATHTDIVDTLESYYDVSIEGGNR
jgi:hypothetical protein